MTQNNLEWLRNYISFIFSIPEVFQLNNICNLFSGRPQKMSSPSQMNSTGTMPSS